MALLGAGFPAEKRRAFVQKKLVPGCVIRIEVSFPKTSKPKFLVLVADDDPDYWLFVVNSLIHPFVASRQDLLRSQVKIDAREHAFLKRDSFLACDKILRFRRDDVIRELTKDLDSIQGDISENVQEHLLAAVKFATTLSPAEKTKILGSFEE